MNASAFRDIWAGVKFQVLKIARAAGITRAILRFLIFNILKEKKKENK